MTYVINSFAVNMGEPLAPMTDRQVRELDAEIKRTCDGPGNSPKRKHHKLAKRRADKKVA